LITDEDEEEYFEKNIMVMNPSRNSIINPPFYVSMNIMDKIARCCLIDGGSRTNVMSKIIMEELGISCMSNENLKNMLAYNNQK